jgi:excisionase family DNA binding protein
VVSLDREGCAHLARPRRARRMSVPTFTASDAATRCGISRRTLVRMIDTGRLEATRDESGAWTVTRDALLAAGLRLDAPSPPDAARSADVELAELRAELAVARVRADAAERARDAAERHAETLAKIVQDMSRALPPAPVAAPEAGPSAAPATAAPPRRRWWHRDAST